MHDVHVRLVLAYGVRCYRTTPSVRYKMVTQFLSTSHVEAEFHNLSFPYTSEVQGTVLHILVQTVTNRFEGMEE
jgi:hypothetical protein